jgi:hypothetical protein
LKKHSRKNNPPQDVATKALPEEILVRKSQSDNVLGSVIWLGLGVMSLGAALQKPFDIGLFFLLLPFTAIFFFVGYFYSKHRKNVIIANSNGLLVEDISKETITWDRINNIRIKASYHPRCVCELSLTLKSDDKLFNRLLFKSLRKNLPTRSITVCDLFSYNINHEYFFEVLRKMQAYYTKRNRSLV